MKVLLNDVPDKPHKGEALHRVVFSVAFLLTVGCFFLTYLGIDTYLESGRSLLGDIKGSVGYLWKGDSCRKLFEGRLFEPIPPALVERSGEICRIARSRGIPPIGLKPIIGKAPYAAEGGDRAAAGFDPTQSFLLEAKASLMRQLPQLESQYGQHRRTISFLWLFFPGVLGAIGCYFYSRRYTPLLFAAMKKRFSRIMFEKNKYSEAYDNLVKLNKRQL